MQQFIHPSIALPKIKTNKSEKIKHSTYKAVMAKVSAVLLILALLFASGWKIKNDTDGKILPKVTVAGINIGGKTPDEAKRIILSYIDSINKKGPSINHETQTLNSTLPELGVSFDADKIVADAYNFGRDGSFKQKVISNSQIIFTGHDIALSPKVDESKLDDFLSKINQEIEKPAQNASLSIDNGNISIIAEKPGFGFDKDVLKNDLIHAIKNKITLKTSILQPKIFADDTLDAQKQAESLMATAPINLIYQDDNYIISRSEIGSWIEFKEVNDKLVADLSKQKVNSYTDKVASKIKVKKIDREIMEGTGEVLVEGQDGIGVDTEKLLNNVLNQVKSNNNNSISIGTYPITKIEIIRNPHAQPGRFAGRYIDVNLSEQTLYAFDGYTMVNHFLISSGKTGPTPTGTYSVYGKTRSQTMDGPGYSVPNVEWISWWSGDYSIHGTYWHNNFGHPMSHGCINASNGDAEWIYNWDEIGTPVFIHW